MDEWGYQQNGGNGWGLTPAAPHAQSDAKKNNDRIY
jgi:hypothetical protein